MGDNSKIEWCEASWNPVTGCSHVSPGCDHCYAETLSHRYKWTTKPWGAQHAAENVKLHPERLDQPLRWQRPRRVFVNSMSDLFHEQVPDDFIDRVFAVMALAPQHSFQILTKRPERMRRYFTRTSSGASREELVYEARLVVIGRHYLKTWPGWPLPNAWLGASVEDQPRYEQRIGELIMTPATVRFLSCEPLLGPLAFGDHWNLGLVRRGCAISWMIVGGESGPGARPMDVQWARDIVAQCRAARVPVFVKQLGARAVEHIHTGNATVPMVRRLGLRDRKGGAPSEWPEDLRVRDYPR